MADSEDLQSKETSEARFIRRVLLGCALTALIAVSGCVALFVFGIRSISKTMASLYEAPPAVEIAKTYAEPDVIRLFLGLATAEEVATIPAGLYRLSEGDINAYLRDKVEDETSKQEARVKVENGLLILYCSHQVVTPESSGNQRARAPRFRLVPGIRVSYRATLRVTAENGLLRLEPIAIKQGRFSEKSIRSASGDLPGTSPFASLSLGLPMATEAQRLLSITYRGISYGPAVAWIELHPLEVRIQVAAQSQISPSL